MAFAKLNPGAGVIGHAVDQGSSYLGNAWNSVGDPTINIHPAVMYANTIGAPNGIDLNSANVNDLPRNTATIASWYQDAEPTVIKQHVIDSSLANRSVAHFIVLPPIESKDKISGISVMYLEFNSAPYNPAPEGASGSLIRHKFEKVSMSLERYGQAMELHDDFVLTPAGMKMYDAYIQTLANDLVLTAQIGITTALLRCHDNKRAYMNMWGPRNGRGMTPRGINDINQMFGVLYKDKKAFYKLSNYASTMGRTQGSAPFTHVFMTERIKSQVAFGDSYDTDLSQRGPEAITLVKNGADAVNTMPNGLQIVVEKDYNLDGTTMEPGERLQMLESHVSVGRWNTIILDPQIVDVERPNPTRDMNLGYLDLDAGEGQIKIQKYVDLISALICWQTDGNLNAQAYDELCNGNAAERLAEQLGITKLTSEKDEKFGPLLDPFIVHQNDGIRRIVHHVGNMHPAYLDNETEYRIAATACDIIKNQLTPQEWSDLQFAIKFANDNYNAALPSDYVTEFIMTTTIDRAKNVPYPQNRFGCPDIRPLPDAETDASKPRTLGNFTDAPNFPLTGIFPGYSCVQHLWTVRDFVSSASFDSWKTKIPGFAQYIDSVVAGINALEKLAKACRRVWSTNNANNIFFSASSLPIWNRYITSSPDALGLDAFIQNLILGVRYPLYVGLNISGSTAIADAKTNVGAVLDFLFTKLFDKSVIDVPPSANDAIVQAVLTNNMLGDGVLAVYADPAKAFDDLNNEEGLTGDNIGNVAGKGWAYVIKILKANYKADVSSDKEAIASAKFLVEFFNSIRRKLDIYNEEKKTGVFSGDAQLTETDIKMIISFRKTMSSKRKFVRVEDTAAATMAADNQKQSLADMFQGDVVNVSLSVSPLSYIEYFKSGVPAALYTAKGNLFFFADVTNPGYNWVDVYGNDPAVFTAGIIPDRVNLVTKIAKSQYHIDTTVMGVHAMGVFSDIAPPVSRDDDNNKRMRVDTDYDYDSPVSAGARYISIPQKRAYPDNMRDEYHYDHDDPMDTGAGSFNPFRKAPHNLAFGDNLPVIHQANNYFQYRWDRVVEMFGGDMCMLVQHFLLYGLRVHRDSFVNMALNGVPPPIGVLTVDPFVEIKMTHAIFAVAGCGNTYFAFPKLSTNYDADHKILHAYMTCWLKAFVDRPQNVFIAENVAFNGYLCGGDGSLVRSIYTDDGVEPVDGFDYDPVDPSSRRANRFALHIGASTRINDIPNPLPLNGSFGGRGAYHGIGRFISERDTGRAAGSPLYDSALLTNLICKFYMLNRSSGKVTDIEDYFERSAAIEGSYNMLCFMADQFGRDYGSGSHKRRTMTGTGPFGKLCEDVVPILNGDPGLISTKLEITGQ